MTEQLLGKTAIVGASSGIGTAIAKELVATGANVVLAARNVEKLRGIVGEFDQLERTLCVQADMTNQKDANTLAERFTWYGGNSPKCRKPI